jgi:hypothetical protein
VKNNERTLQQRILDQLKAGMVVVAVYEEDELLAIEAAKMAATAIGLPFVVLDALDSKLTERMMKGKKEVLFVSDSLRTVCSPAYCRLIRAHSMSETDTRIILLERPDMAQSVQGAIGTLIGEVGYQPWASKKELTQEVVRFLNDSLPQAKLPTTEIIKIVSALGRLTRLEAVRVLALSLVTGKAINKKTISYAMDLVKIPS